MHLLKHHELFVNVHELLTKFMNLVESFLNLLGCKQCQLMFPCQVFIYSVNC